MKNVSFAWFMYSSHSECRCFPSWTLAEDAKSLASNESAQSIQMRGSPVAKAKKLNEEVKMDRRGTKGRRKADRGIAVAEEKPAVERRKKTPRRRQIDPTTCERDYTTEEIEFMRAMDLYKRNSGRMFPTCSEILEVVRDLGYAKQAPSTEAPSAPVVANPEMTEGPLSESVSPT